MPSWRRGGAGAGGLGRAVPGRGGLGRGADAGRASARRGCRGRAGDRQRAARGAAGRFVGSAVGLPVGGAAAVAGAAVCGRRAGLAEARASGRVDRRRWRAGGAGPGWAGRVHAAGAPSLRHGPMGAAAGASGQRGAAGFSCRRTHCTSQGRGCASPATPIASRQSRSGGRSSAEGRRRSPARAAAAGALRQGLVLGPEDFRAGRVGGGLAGAGRAQAGLGPGRCGGSGPGPGARSLVVAAHEADQPTLDPHLVRAEDAGLIGGVGGLQSDGATPLLRRLRVASSTITRATTISPELAVSVFLITTRSPSRMPALIIESPWTQP
jgi:hypothetical protein